MKKLILTIAAVLLTSTLTACGGGGGGSSSPVGPSYTGDFTGSAPEVGGAALQKSSASGDTIYVDIEVDGVSNFFGADIRISIDDSMVALGGDCSAGALLPGATAYCSQSGNEIIIGVSLVSPASPVSGSGVIVTVPLKVTAAGVSAVDFGVAALYDNGSPIPAQVTVNSWTGGMISGV